VAGANLGLLGLDLTNRRRNSLNGRTVSVDADGFELIVHQSFGNCAKYIEIRKGITADGKPTYSRGSLASSQAVQLRANLGLGKNIGTRGSTERKRKFGP